MSVYRDVIPNYSQQDATFLDLFTFTKINKSRNVASCEL